MKDLVDKYLEFTREIAIYPKKIPDLNAGLMYCAFGLTNEAGEAAGVVKKMLRDSGGQLTEEVKDKLKKELGDVCWYLFALADEAGLSIKDILEANIAKLTDRKERGVLGGSGDER